MVLSPLFVTPEWFYWGPQYLKTKKKQKLGFPIEDFGNDGGGGIPTKDFRNAQKWETLEGEGDKVLAHLRNNYNICSDLIFFSQTLVHLDISNGFVVYTG